MDNHSQWNSHFKLQARSGWGNILQKGVGPLCLAILVSPADLYHVCAQHANF